MEATMLLQPAVFLPGPAPVRAPDQYDRLLEAATRLHLRPLPDQTARIDWAEMRERLERRQKADDCPPPAVLGLDVAIAELREEQAEIARRLAPKPVPVAAPARAKPRSRQSASVALPQPTNRMWNDSPDAERRRALFARQRELPGLIYGLEKRREVVGKLPKCELHLRGLLFRPGADYIGFNRDPEEFDLQLQGLLPQLREDELFVILAEVEVHGRAAMDLYGSEEPRFDFRPFMVHLPSEYKDVLQQAACNKVLFCALDPRTLS
jgi:hypothetical protein